MPNYRLTIGPGVKAALYLMSLLIAGAIGYALCHYGVRVDVAEANLYIYKDDTQSKAAIDTEYQQNKKLTEERIDETVYSTDCASMPITDMRK